MKKPYQDIWRNGRVVRPGRRDCAGRYAAIRDVLERDLGREFSVADVGGWDGYFAVRLAEDLGAKAENIDPRRVNLRLHRQMRVTAENVENVGYHDAILCLSVLHHLEDWEAVYEGLKAQCKTFVVEVCHPDEAKGDLSPVIAATADRIAPIHERVSEDAVDLIAETPCLDDRSIMRPTYLVRGDAWPDDSEETKPDTDESPEKRTVCGVVESGTGKAATLMGELTDADWEPLGYVPFPGTLNVAVSETDRDFLKALDGVEAPGLRRSTHYVPVAVPGPLAPVEAHVHFARSPGGRPEKVIEILAPVDLRNLGYEDGDKIEVTPR